MGLFQRGGFILNAGAKSPWKLECDALTDDDITCLAYLIRRLVGPFGSVEGAPRGGLRLAKALETLRTEWRFDETSTMYPHLIVDDVLTTGGSMEKLRAGRSYTSEGARIIGAVIFARGPLPWWVRAVCPLPEPLWLKKEE